MTYTEFIERFPTNEACLNYLRDRFYPNGTPCPKCAKPSRFHKIKGRSAYSCQHCGHHVYPTAGTVFHKSTTSLHLWFWAIFLMSATRCGISAKQLEREIGVSNKTALRMFRQIRKLLHEEGELLGARGPVEVDETYVGAKRKRGAPRGRPGPTHPFKTPVMGLLERDGRLVARVVPDTTSATLRANVHEFVLPSAMIYTDEYQPYRKLGQEGYTHRRVNHSARIYVEGDVHTNSIEGFFGLFKNGVRGVYHSVSKKHLQSYVDEYAFRYNRRNSTTPMFWAILDRVQQDQPADA
jgi:transposase-like protein